MTGDPDHAPSATGSTGSTHGDNAVAAPATNAKTISTATPWILMTGAYGFITDACEAA